MNYRLKIFDFDGVLADSLSACCEAVNDLRATHFPSLPHVASQEDLALLYCGPLRTCLRRFGLSDDECKRFFDLHSAAMQAKVSSIPLFSDVVEIFLSLPESERAIVTSAYSQTVRCSLSRYAPENVVAEVKVLGREQRRSKTEKIGELRNSINVDQREIIKIGDTVSDILYARETGIPVCVVGWGYHPINFLLAFDPTFAAATPRQLESIISADQD